MSASLDTTVVPQPIIRGIQAVGSVDISYKYNSSNGQLVFDPDIINIREKDAAATATSQYTAIDTSNFIHLAGFRLDSQFLQAAQQIASSAVIPILGGGGLALTNNNRTGALTINCTRVGVPQGGKAAVAGTDTTSGTAATVDGRLGKINAMGVLGDGAYYDMTMIAQMQQAQAGGDSCGSTIRVSFKFMGYSTTIEFQCCTISNVAPVRLSGNDASDYGVQINYLNWTVCFEGISA